MSLIYLPGAKFLPVAYRGEAGRFAPGMPLGYIPHVPVSNGSLYAYFNGLRSPNRKFSTAWLAKDGHSEQYTELTMKPWAQGAGNGQYHAFEVEGYPAEPYTPEQIETLAVWHNALGTADRLADGPGQSGIGTHAMGGGPWGGHTCPGPGPRAGQRQAIIDRARALRGGSAPIPVTVPTSPNRPTSVPVSGRPPQIAVDGIFGGGTKRRLQQWAGVATDGQLGPVSWAAIQAKVGASQDGIVGPNTWRAVQRLVGSPADGVPGPNTYRALQYYLNRS